LAFLEGVVVNVIVLGDDSYTGVLEILTIALRGFLFKAGEGGVGVLVADCLLRPVPRFKTFGGGLEALNTAREDVVGFQARFTGRAPLSGSSLVRLERRVTSITPTILH
jgi:hypothetical protein